MKGLVRKLVLLAAVLAFGLGQFGGCGSCTPDTVLPIVQITSPTDGSPVSGTVDIVVTATDNDGVVKVEFYIDGSKVGEDTSSPYIYSWNTITYSEGSHDLKARAYDNAGNIGESPIIRVNVNKMVKVLVIRSDTPGSYFYGSWVNSYNEAYNCMLQSPYISAEIVSDTDIASDPSILDEFEVLLIPDNGPSDAAVSIITDWYNTGKGIVAVDSGACFLNYAIFTPGDNGLYDWWKYAVDTLKILSSHYITQDYSVGWEKEVDTVAPDEAYYFKNIIQPISGMTLLAQQIDNPDNIAIFAYEGTNYKRIVFVGPNDIFDPELDNLMIRACLWAGKAEISGPVKSRTRVQTQKPGVRTRQGK